MKKFEKLAVVLIILWGLNVVLTALTPIWVFQLMDSSSLKTARLIALSLSTLIKCLSAVACGVWLYLEAKRESRSTWLWCLAGLAFQIPAVIAFVAFIILKEIRNEPPTQRLHSVADAARAE
jgi:hypothetical protein